MTDSLMLARREHRFEILAWLFFSMSDSEGVIVTLNLGALVVIRLR